MRDMIVVTGTTPGYIDWIRRKAPGVALFLTDPFLRRGAVQTDPCAWEEILCDLSDYGRVELSLRAHLNRWRIRPVGVACYDGDSLDLASFLAERLGLPFVSRGAVSRCRDRFRSRRLWKEHGISCPETRPILDAEDLVAFRAEREVPVVLKPLRGTGGELVFFCDSPGECRSAHATLLDAIGRRPALGGIVAEEYIPGARYSCDFTVSGGNVRLLRLTRSIPARREGFGEAAGYLLCSRQPEWQSGMCFSETLRRCAAALGISLGFCALDFIVSDGAPVLLGLVPCPEGDCLPQLLRVARGVDVILGELAFARGRSAGKEWHGGGPTFLGLRLIARRDGVVREIATGELERDPRVLEVGVFRKPGHRIVLPPEDYGSRILGYAVARLDGREPEVEAAELASLWYADIG